MAACAAGWPALATAAVPTQYIAKVYTEFLGRAPDPSAWSGNVSSYGSNGCSTATLRSQGQSILASSEFTNIGYSNAQKVIVLYRGILDRDADGPGLSSHISELNGGESLSQVADELYNSAEFANLVPSICSGNPYFFSKNGGVFATAPPGSSSMAESDLQSALNNAAVSRGTVTLPESTVVALTSPIEIPPGVTLTTAGNPGPNAHAKMARLIRGQGYQPGSSGFAMVELDGGAVLQNIWVDGERGVPGYSNGIPQPHDVNEANIRIFSGTGTAVNSNFISNSVGWTSLLAIGSAETGIPCSNVSISNNTVTVYASVDSTASNTGNWTDGISDSCEGSTVNGNNIIDATDGGIVLFRAETQNGGAVQSSQVTYNTIVSAGNYAFGALILDPLSQSGGCPSQRDFSGSYVGNNTLFSGPNTGFTIGLAVGTAEWFYSSGGCLGTGANVSNNTTAGIVTRFNDPIAIEGMLNATVQGNGFSTTPVTVPRGSCQRYNIVAGISAGQASGNLQGPVDAFIHDCINS